MTFPIKIKDNKEQIKIRKIKKVDNPFVEKLKNTGSTSSISISTPSLL